MQTQLKDILLYKYMNMQIPSASGHSQRPFSAARQRLLMCGLFYVGEGVAFHYPTIYNILFSYNRKTQKRMITRIRELDELVKLGILTFEVCTLKERYFFKQLILSSHEDARVTRSTIRVWFNKKALVAGAIREEDFIASVQPPRSPYIDSTKGAPAPRTKKELGPIPVRVESHPISDPLDSFGPQLLDPLSDQSIDLSHS